MDTIAPWGKLDWLQSKIGNKNWLGIVCSSFESRCLAFPEWLSKLPINSHYCLNISDPENRYSEEIRNLTNSNEKTIKQLLGRSLKNLNAELLAEPVIWNSLALEISAQKDVSLMLDIS
ncbi:hypothetical protein, partial [Pseudomonas syringae]|uniref:hypothetical protein n=1 Tax=Pseudomonas syringae TaxID=317 RepID=UPI0011129956